LILGRWLTLGVLFLLAFGLRPAHAAPLAPNEVPEPLKPWVPWVLHDDKTASCATLFGKDTERRCAWPERLELDLTEKGGTFKQTWQVDAPLSVPLPGDDKRWPLDVKVNGRAEPVSVQDGKPTLRLGPGVYKIQGTFRWESLPEAITVPPETGIVELTLRGQAVPFPNLTTQGQLFLAKTKAEDGQGARLEIVVHRKLTDQVPLRMITRIVLNVSGKSREVLLGRSLPAGFVPMALNAPLPVRIENEGRLRVQLRPGTYTIELTSRAPGPLTELKRPIEDGPWREGDEIWVFEAKPELRAVNIEGVVAVDPQQTSLPDDWKKLPAFIVPKAGTMQLTPRSRGSDEKDFGDLSLQRTLWLDFDGAALSVSDTIQGSVNRATRIDAIRPMVLGRVAMQGRDQFITTLGSEDRAGVEVRQGPLQLTADSRMARDGAELTAIGYDLDFHSVRTTLSLPPGWRLLHAGGVDDVPGTWLKHWTLLELFLVIILGLGAIKLLGPKGGALALVTFVLTFPESDAPKWLWCGVFLFEAVARAVPEGTAKKVLFGVRHAALATIALVAVPFLIAHVRGGIYPALSNPAAAASDGSLLDGLVPAKGEAAAPATEEAEMAGADAPAAPPVGGASPASPMVQQAPTTLPRAANFDAPVDVEKKDEGRKQQMVGGKLAPSSTSRPGWAAAQYNMESYDPGALVQTGPGKPQWTWTRVPLNYSGPVDRAQKMRLYLAPPAVNLVLALLRAACLIGLVWVLRPRISLRGLGKGQGPSAAAVAAAVVLLCMLPAQVAHAETTPSKEVLDELKKRLTEKQPCAPNCASASRMLLELAGSDLTLRIEIHAQAAIAVPLPGDATGFRPSVVLVDGKPAQALARLESGKTLWLALAPGVHQITMRGTLPERESVSVPLPLRPHQTEVKAVGWTVAGVHEDGATDQDLQLVRVQKEIENAFSPSTLPPFLRVERTIRIGLNWQVDTRVVRVSPGGSVAVAEVPLLAGESVTTPEVRVVSGKALVNMPADATEVSWKSVLQERSPIKLTAAKDAAFTELWRLDASPIWHVRTDGLGGISAIKGTSLPEWHPFPGESAELAVERPKGVTGQTLTIDKSEVHVVPGLRLTETTLTVDLRASRGSEHAFMLPEGATLSRVTINGTVQPVRADGRKLVLPVVPGAQKMVVVYHLPQGIETAFRVPMPDLGTASVNANTQVAMSDARWVLFVWGPRLGPAVLFWSLLLVLVVVALMLGRISFAPMKTWQWVLLFIGLSQVHVAAGAIVVGWLVAMGYRGTPQAAALRWDLFNLRQLALAALTFAAAVVLIVAIHQGLLGAPAMQIQGNSSSATLLRFYEDRIGNVASAPFVLSVPMLAYRGLMLAWALWLAITVLRWARVAWKAFTEGGAWKKAPPMPMRQVYAPQGPAGYPGVPMQQPLQQQPVQQQPVQQQPVQQQPVQEQPTEPQQAPVGDESPAGSEPPKDET